MSDLPFQPVILLGAGRSGTNMLRDALSMIDGIETWPCDEIQPIWRHGTLSHGTDALTAEHATPDIRSFIRAAFMKLWSARGRPAIVLEKTCANTLRVPFISAVLPEARFVSITRHGGDVVPSAVLRWQGKLEVPPLSYFAAKARYIPPSDLHFYAASFLRNRVGKLLGHAPRLRTWGPIWGGLEQVQTCPLPEICAHQWVACSHAAGRDLSLLPTEAVSHTTYERFVDDPISDLTRLCAAMDYPIEPAQAEAATAMVRRKQIDLGPRHGQHPRVYGILAPECAALGYGV